MKSPLAISASALALAAGIGWSGACAGDDAGDTGASLSQGTSMSGVSNTNPS